MNQDKTKGTRDFYPEEMEIENYILDTWKKIARSYNYKEIEGPILESAEAAEEINEGDELELDIKAGTIKNLNSGKIYQAQPFPGFMQNLINAGGLISYIKTKINTPN